MAKIKILIVDDEDETRGMYAEVFKREGFIVTEAIDGVDGLDRATKEMPDVIFTGIIMPRMDGFALKDALAKNVATAKIPVMMSSHMGREEDRLQAGKLGIKEFIVQGMVSPRQVVEKVKAMFGSADYLLKFDVNAQDAQKLAQDFRFNSHFQCPRCSNDLSLALSPSNPNNREFKAKFVCPKCRE
jgi:two-component system chemotaxis response regulator CheY